MAVGALIILAGDRDVMYLFLWGVAGGLSVLFTIASALPADRFAVGLRMFVAFETGVGFLDLLDALLRDLGTFLMVPLEPASISRRREGRGGNGR